ncbi:MAG: calcium-binding protein, partial [Alphaproteobacteria bacterium]
MSADTLTGTSDADQIYGWEGDDSLSSGAGIDWVYGDAGNDTLDGGDGDDSLYGGEGFNLLLGQSGNDYLSTYFTAGNSTLEGGDGNDTLYGGNGDDRFIGGSGQDYLSGSGANDTLDGGAGSDTLLGGNGNDVYYIDNLFDSVFDSGGNDTAYVSASFVALPSSIENIVYTNGALPLPYWIDALLADYEGGYAPAILLGPERTFGYAFPTTAPSYLSSTYTNGYTAFSSIQIARTEEALRYIESIIDVRSVQTTNAAAPNVFSFASNTQYGSGGYAFYPSTTFYGSDVFLNNTSYNATFG